MNLHHSWNSSQYEKTSELQAAVADDLIKNLEIKPDENVLDVGCGLGNITIKIASIAYKGYVLGIDDSSIMIDQAKENLMLKGLGNISFKVMSVTELQCNDRFDVILSNSVFHWIKQQEMVLHLIRRCLKPGGRIGLQFPLLNALHPMVKIIQEAIHSLQLGQKYEKWSFPWFVPESTNVYADLLRQISFKDVTIREVETIYTFETVSTVFGFFKSVGIDLYLQPLSQEERVLLKDEIIKLIERDNGENGIKFNFHRLYVHASI